MVNGWSKMETAKKIYYSICPCGHIMLGWKEYSDEDKGSYRRRYTPFLCPKCGTDRRKFKRTFKKFDIEKFKEIFIRGE